MNKHEKYISKGRGKLAAAQPTVTPIHDAVYLGLDVHSEHIRVVRQIDNSSSQPAQRLSWEKLPEFVRKQFSLAKKVYAVYEAGAFGFGLYRQLKDLGVECYVIKPCKLDPQRRGVQTDASDARELADMLVRYVRGNPRAMVVVRVPTPEQEAQRRQARHRRYLKKELNSVCAHGRGVLLNQGLRQVGAWWGELSWKSLLPQLSEPVRAELEDCRKLIELYRQLLKPVETKLVESAPKELPLGFGALTFVLLAREIYQWERFKTRRNVGGFLGLCGGVSSSGPAHYDLSITKMGDPHLRALLIELAWRMVRYQPNYKAVIKWQGILKGPAKAHRRHRKRAIVALARQVAVDVWKWQTKKVTPEELGWQMATAD